MRSTIGVGAADLQTMFQLRTGVLCPVSKVGVQG